MAPRRRDADAAGNRAVGRGLQCDNGDTAQVSSRHESPPLLSPALRRRSAATIAPGRSTKRPPAATSSPPIPSAAASARDYLKDYLRWLWPERWAVAAVFVLAIVAAGLEMIEPLFMRFITDRVLLDDRRGDAGSAAAPEPRRRRVSGRHRAVGRAQSRRATIGNGSSTRA